MTATKTSEAMDAFFLSWREALNSRPVDAERRDRAIREARLALRDKQNRDYGWFEQALADRKKKMFVAIVFEKSLPKRLLRPMLLAAVRDTDASSNRWFVRPAIRAFGVPRVSSLLHQMYDEEPTEAGRVAISSALYWLIDGRRLDEERVRNKGLKLSAEERLRWFINTKERSTRIALIHILPFRDPGVPQEIRKLLDQALQVVRQAGDEFLQSQMRSVLDLPEGADLPKGLGNASTVDR